MGEIFHLVVLFSYFAPLLGQIDGQIFMHKAMLCLCSCVAYTHQNCIFKPNTPMAITLCTLRLKQMPLE